MNKITNLNLSTALLFLASAFTLNAQETHETLKSSAPYQSDATNSANKTMQSNCTDKINYCGNVNTNVVTVGGAQNSINHIDGVYQVFPAYKGSVTGVEFDAAKQISSATNPVMRVQLFDVSSSGVALWGTPLSSAFSVTINTTSSNSYMVNFPTPVSITGNYGFAVGVTNYVNSDSAIVMCRTLTTTAPYSYLTVYTNSNTYSFPQFYSVNVNLFIRPIVTTSVNPTWLTARTSTGCGTPVVYNFTNTTSPPPSYVTNTLITQGITRSLDFGDGSAVVSSFPTSSSPLVHSYTALGTFTASYTQTYVGWTANCVGTETILVSVDNPLPSFTYNTNGLTVTFTNTSQNLTSYSWNFGDLSTSTQSDPNHTFSSPGTYVVELEGTAPCGTVRYSTSVVVTGNSVGIKENGSISKLISIYPNPAANTLQINNKSQEAVNSRIEILSSVGALIKVVNAVNISGTTSIDVSDLSRGMYFIKLKSTRGDIVKSFVKE